LTLGEQQHFRLRRRIAKHKMTIMWEEITRW